MTYTASSTGMLSVVSHNYNCSAKLQGNMPHLGTSHATSAHKIECVTQRHGESANGMVSMQLYTCNAPRVTEDSESIDGSKNKILATTITESNNAIPFATAIKPLRCLGWA